MPSTVEAHITAHYQVADCSLKINIFDEQSAPFIENYLSKFQFKSAAINSNSTDADCTLTFNSGDKPELPSVHDFRLSTDTGTYITRDSQSFAIIKNSLIVANSCASKSVSVWLSPAAAKHDVESAEMVCRFAVHFALRRCGLYNFHAAAVSKFGSHRCALIIGKSGSGKSTLTIQLARAGWSFLSDDALLLKSNSTEIKAYGFRSVLALTQETMDTCFVASANGVLIGENTDKPKYVIAAEELFPRQFIKSSTPQALIFNRIADNDASSIRKLSQAETMMLLINACPWASFEEPDTARAYLKMLQRLIEQTMAYELHAGRDILRSPDVAAKLIGDCLT